MFISRKKLKELKDELAQRDVDCCLLSGEILELRERINDLELDKGVVA